MKVAVSAIEKGIESEIDVRFGRCAFFVIAEIEDKKVKELKSIPNPNVNVGGGAGTSAAQIVANEGAEAIITGNIGPRAYDVFSQFGIEIYQTTGKIKDALEKLASGELKPTKSATKPMGK